MFSKEITTTAEDYRTLVKFTEYSLKKSNNILFIAMAVLAVASLVIGLAGIIPLYISAAVCLLCVAVILTDILLIIQLERIDIFRTDIRITDFGRIKIPISDIRLHEKEFRTGDAARIRSQQFMFLRERIA